MAAAPGLYISKANPLQWIIKTGTGTIHEDEVLDGNFEAPTSNPSTNVRCFTGCDYVQCWECGDVIKNQIIMDSADGKFPIVKIYDADDNLIETILWPDMLAETSVYQFEFEPDTGMCGVCYRMKLYSITIPGDAALNLYVNNDNGTFENLPFTFVGGGANAVSRSNAIFQQGAWSMRIDSPALPVPGDDQMAIDGATITLVTGNTYYASAYVYNKKNGSNSYAPPGSDVGILITASGAGWGGNSGWVDATILNETRYNYNADGTNVWVKIDVTFTVNADVTGSIAFQLYGWVPDPAQDFYVDHITIAGAPIIDEAYTNLFRFNENGRECSCGSTLVTYGAKEGEEHSQFGLIFNSSTLALPFTIRLGIEWMQFKIQDSDFVNVDNSQKTYDLIRAGLAKIYNCRSETVPFWMLEKICMIMKFDLVLFDGLSLICNSKDINIQFPIKSLCGFADWEMVLKEYNYQNFDCGAV